MKATIEVYKYTELEGKAKDRAREWADPTADGWPWAEFTLDDWNSKLTDLGYSEPKISYSGFWCQGDGASFTARVYLRDWIAAHKCGKEYQALLRAIRLSHCDDTVDVVRIDNHYSHWNTVAVNVGSHSFYAEATVKAEEQAAELFNAIGKEVKDLSHEIYDDLREEYEYLTSEENIAEHCEANGYLFDRYGRPIHSLLESLDVAEVASA